MTDFACVFPGQGSQAVGMSVALAAAYPVVQKTYSEASAILGYDLWRLMAEGPEQELNQTQHTQPAMLTAGVAVWRVLQESRAVVTPRFFAGHSLGEYTALVCAGYLSFAEAVRLVQFRAQCMQEAVPAGVGAMAAILGLEDAVIAAGCRDAAQGQVLSPVNFNAPGQTVIAGHKTAVERALVLLKQQGAKRTVLLPVSVPSHCSLMISAAEKFATLLGEVSLKQGCAPVIMNVSARPETDVLVIAALLKQQLYCPVRWVESVNVMVHAGVRQILEVGPGKVLAALNKRIDKNLQAVAVWDPASVAEAIAVIST